MSKINIRSGELSFDFFYYVTKSMCKVQDEANPVFWLATSTGLTCYLCSQKKDISLLAILFTKLVQLRWQLYIGHVMELYFVLVHRINAMKELGQYPANLTTYT